MSDIFISYANVDRPRVEPLVQALRAQGWSVWWDRTILPGKTWNRVLETALAEARCVIVLWTQNSVKSDWVQGEADEARRRRILVPVLLDEVPIPMPFRSVQAANLVGWRGQSNPDFEVLVRAISEIVKAPRREPHAEGHPAGSPAGSSGNVQLSIEWKGQFALIDFPISIILDNSESREGSFIDGFAVVFRTVPGAHTIRTAVVFVPRKPLSSAFKWLAWIFAWPMMLPVTRDLLTALSRSEIPLNVTSPGSYRLHLRRSALLGRFKISQTGLIGQ